jgi:Domain of unknown function (DUF4189)
MKLAVWQSANFQSSSLPVRGLMNMTRRFFARVAIVLVAAVTAGPTQVVAEGALAVGIAPSGSAAGYTSGVGVNEATTNAAREKALSICKSIAMSSGAAVPTGVTDARARCAVVATFRNQCVTIAFDPKDGTPGAGWAVAATQKAADEQALSRCRDTAGTDRRTFCKVSVQRCDGTAN